MLHDKCNILKIYIVFLLENIRHFVKHLYIEILLIRLGLYLDF